MMRLSDRGERRERLLLWLTLAAGILLAAPARAEDKAPRLQIGGSLSVIVPIVFEDGPFIVAGGGPSLTVKPTPRIGIELLADALGPFAESPGTMGLYLTQLKLPIRRSPGGRRTLSFTIGAAGGIWYNRRRETRISRPDGSTVVYPGYRILRADGPNTISLGLARDQNFGRSASVSVAMQTFMGALGGIAVRASAGVSVGIARSR